MGVLIFVGIFCAILLGDIAIKMHVEKTVKEGEEQETINGRIQIRNVHNQGMMLGVLSKYPYIVKWMSAGMGIVLTLYYIILLCRKGKWLEKMGLSMVLAGAWSNIYDRMLKGYVVDYFGIRTKWKRLTDITYNLGDMFIFVGSIFVVLAAVFGRKK